MLGCQDFCGYYDWTFHFMRREFGEKAVLALWAEAIATESQSHYLEAGRKDGLRGLDAVWNKTGEDEHCDWTFTLDTKSNVLRCDMRECPSKGLLLNNDLNADEDYCDHCMGWIGPMLGRLGLVADHQHNHAGQCWWEMHPREGPWKTLDLPADIRKDPRWGQGYLHLFKGSVKLPMLPEVGPDVDSTEVLERWFARAGRVLVLGRGPSARDPRVKPGEHDAVVVTDRTYAARDIFDGRPLAVLVSDRSQVLPEVARRFNATAPADRPLLMHACLPAALKADRVDFVSHGLPRPVPILPTLIRRGLYTHVPNGPCPSTGIFLALLAAALARNVTVAGIDPDRGAASASDRHSRACEVEHLRKLAAYPGATVRFIGAAGQLVT